MYIVIADDANILGHRQLLFLQRSNQGVCCNVTGGQDAVEVNTMFEPITQRLTHGLIAKGDGFVQAWVGLEACEDMGLQIALIAKHHLRVLYITQKRQFTTSLLYKMAGCYQTAQVIVPTDDRVVAIGKLGSPDHHGDMLVMKFVERFMSRELANDEQAGHLSCGVELGDIGLSFGRDTLKQQIETFGVERICNVADQTQNEGVRNGLQLCPRTMTPTLRMAPFRRLAAPMLTW